MNIYVPNCVGYMSPCNFPATDHLMYFVMIFAFRVSNRHSSSSASSPSVLSGLMSRLLVFRRRDVWRPLLLFLAISLFQQFAGVSSISYYAVNVFVQAGSSIDEVKVSQPRSGWNGSSSTYG